MIPSPDSHVGKLRHRGAVNPQVPWELSQPSTPLPHPLCLPHVVSLKDFLTGRKEHSRFHKWVAKATGPGFSLQIVSGSNRLLQPREVCWGHRLGTDWYLYVRESAHTCCQGREGAWAPVLLGAGAGGVLRGGALVPTPPSSLIPSMADTSCLADLACFILPVSIY